VNQPEAGRHPARPLSLPSHEKLTRLVARSLGLSPQELEQGLNPATDGDVQDILTLRHQLLPATAHWDDEAYLRWRYRLGSAKGMGELWRLRCRGRLLAIIGVEDVHLELSGQAARGAQVMDLLARSDTQDSGLGIWLNQAMLARYSFTLAVGANKNSSGIVDRMFHALEPRRTFTCPVDAGPFISRRWPSLPAMGLASQLGNTYLAGRRLLLRAQRSRHLSLEAVQHWPAGASTPPRTSAARVAVQHDDAYMQRRLFDYPRHKVVVQIASRRRMAVGHIAWAHSRDPLGRTELHVLDWGYDTTDTLVRLFEAAVEAAVVQRSTCVRLVIQDHREQRAARRAGFFPSNGDPGRICGVQALDPVLAQQLADAQWSLTNLVDDTDAV
jgi:hypothetical protein